MSTVTDMDDPAEHLEWTTISPPRLRGPGSGTDAWVAFGLDAARANHRLGRLIDQQSAAIRALKGEVRLLKEQIAERRPKGARVPLREELAARIEDEIAHGGTDRGIAARYKVSHMSVYRIRKRRRQRELAAS